MATATQLELSPKPPQRRWWVRYGLALVMFAAVVGLSILLSRLEIRINLTIPVMLGLIATAWYGGRGPGLLIAVLFQTTTIIYAPIPADSTIWKAAFGYFSVFSLYVFLVFVISHLRNSQFYLGEQRDLLQVTLSSIGDAVVATDTQGRVTFMNPVAEKLTGWNRSTALGNPLGEVFRTYNELTGQPVSTPVSTVLQTGQTVGLANHTVLRSKDGAEYPIDNSAAPIKDSGLLRGVILVFSDVSERKAAERSRRENEIMHRIVEAQESERHRIARDLHDHLGQKMTALRLRIEALTDQCGDHPVLGKAVGDLQDSALNIDRDIAYLSWELRPTELENLGLEDALSSFVREWSAHHGIKANFQVTHVDGRDDGHRLPSKVETNIYRILQEALNNVLKHSGARNVDVLLQYRNRQLVLIVEDNGVGFTEETGHGNGMSGPGGLGLVGMRERAAVMNGTLEIDSEAGSGTTIVAKIPFQ